MIRWRPRHPLTMTLRRCLRAAAAPALAATALALILHRALAPTGVEPAAAMGAASPWLHGPLFVVAFGCALAAVTFWPLFAARRPGADWTARLQRGPLRGCGAATAGALLAQLAFSVPLLAVLPQALGAPSVVRGHDVPQAPPQPLLAEPGRALHYTPAPSAGYAELRLRPLAGLPLGPFRASRVELLADGDALTQAPVPFEQTEQTVRITFPARPIRNLELRLVDGTVPLLFPTGSVELVEDAGHPAAVNGLFAALLALLPSFLALAIAGLCGVAAALPTVGLVVGTVLFVLTLGGAGPVDATVRALLVGRWLPATDVFRQCLPSLAVGSAAMIATMVLRRRLRR